MSRKRNCTRACGRNRAPLPIRLANGGFHIRYIIAPNVAASASVCAHVALQRVIPDWARCIRDLSWRFSTHTCMFNRAP